MDRYMRRKKEKWLDFMTFLIVIARKKEKKLR
jgi:hypothetical protein